MRQREGHRQIDRSLDETERGTLIDRQIDGQMDRWIEKYNRQIDRSINRQIDRSVDRQTDRQIDMWQVGRQTERQRKKERERRDFNHLSAHDWLRSAICDSQQPISPIGFLFLKFPPPPCAVLLVPLSMLLHALGPSVVQLLQQGVFLVTNHVQV